MQSFRFRPTIVFALDPLAVSFCEAAAPKLEHWFAGQVGLLQLHAVVFEKDTVSLKPMPASGVRAGTFVAPRRRGVSSAEAAAVFTREESAIEKALIRILEAVSSTAAAEPMQPVDSHIVAERAIHLVVSSVESTAGVVLLELVGRLRLLLRRRFSGELYTVHCTVLLPGLLRDPEAEDHAATYAFLKRLDDAIGRGTAQALGLREDLFTTCWLVDGRNARAVKIGAFDENRDTYADAFVGLLTSEPDRSGPPPSAYASRGKTPAYSAFGFGELYFPAGIAATRLSSALVAQIVTTGFLSTPAESLEQRRMLLLGAKQFLLSPSFRRTIDGLGRSGGASIWRDFSPQVQMRVDAVGEYTGELRRRRSEFESGDLNHFRETLLVRGREMGSEVRNLLDCELDRRTDASAEGLQDALSLVAVLLDEEVPLERDVLGEDPQTLRTELRAARAHLDHRLGVQPTRERSMALSERARELRVRRRALETDLRLAPADAVTSEGPPTARAVDDNEMKATCASSTTNSGEEVRRAIAEVDRELDQVASEYRSSLQEEDREGDQARRDAAQRVERELEDRLSAEEQGLIESAEGLRAAQATLVVLKEERRRYLFRRLIVIPAASVAVVVLLPLLAALAGVGPLSRLLVATSQHLGLVAVTSIAAATLYGAAVLSVYWRDIHRKIGETSEVVDRLRLTVQAGAVRVRTAHNEQLRFRFELFQQDTRIELFVTLVEVGVQFRRDLEGSLTTLRDLVRAFEEARDGAVPWASFTRRPVLTANDLDTYYRKVIATPDSEAEAFLQTWGSRSQVRRVPNDEFRDALVAFARKRFVRLENLSLTDVLLREPELIGSSIVLMRLRELAAAAEPLLRLNDGNAGSPHYAARDATIWITADGHEAILQLLQAVVPGAQARTLEDRRSFRLLQRCLNFPAYYIGAVEHYRACYARGKTDDTLPDLFPEDAQVRRAYEYLLIAVAAGVVERDRKGVYAITGDSVHRLGADRRRIAEQMVDSHAFQPLATRLVAAVEKLLGDRTRVHAALVSLSSATDLDAAEREIVATLTQKYHPLR